ncbi:MULTISPECIES: hypothetical protein [Bacteroidota]|uniref:Uncharacterized protein n=1 Tax=Epilithonimonas hungarica TaxID=454006 RepID=A0A1G7S7X9_9FLAO|nr:MULTISPECIES: hypothetical protein [Bacteroidota]SDG19093.1 hypothetical protein SAMN05421825_2899 [Epilithonimonas hungarica]
MGNSKENQSPILVKIANQLLKDQQELDSLAVQLSLGKAEAKDKFKEVKTEFREKLQDLKHTLSSEYKDSQDWVKETNVAIDEFEKNLEESAEEVFEESKANILKAAENLKAQIKRNPTSEKLFLLYTTYYEKAQLQLDVLEQNIQNKKAELTDSYKHSIEEAKKSAKAIIDKLNDKKEEADFKTEIFKKEIGQVYEHLKKAVKALG